MMDPFLQRVAVVFLGLIALACVIGGVVLALDGTDIPESIVAIGAGAAGALGGAIAITRSGP